MSARRRSARRRTWRRLLLRAAVVAFLIFHAVSASSLLYLRWLPPAFTTVQLQRWVEALRKGVPYHRHYDFVGLEKISDHLEHAVVAAEDDGFFQHHGFDWEALRDAAESQWERSRRRRGGSTITQQLVKNLFLTTHRTWLRKAVEVPLTILAEVLLPKRRILELYLNVVEWGPGVFGADAAARYHYGIPPAWLERTQAARLAACLPAPHRRVPQKMGAVSAVILRHMSRRGW